MDSLERKRRDIKARLNAVRREKKEAERDEGEPERKKMGNLEDDFETAISDPGLRAKGRKETKSREGVRPERREREEEKKKG